MKKFLKNMYKYLSFFLIFQLLVGCTSLDEIPIIDKVTQPDYVSSKKSKKLEIPPELDELSSSDSFTVNGEPTSFKQYLNKDEKNKEKNLINLDEKIKVVKSGNMRWLVIPARQKEVWPVVEKFWEDMGFEIYSSKRAGIIETRWIAESDIKKDDDGLSRFDAWLEALANTTSRRKFRTRIEDGVEEGKTEIYLSQRSSSKGIGDHYNRKSKHYENTINPDTVYQIQEYKSEDEADEAEMKSNYKDDDLEIQYELLRRLMVRLGSSDLSAKDSLDNAVEIKQADLVQEDGYKSLLLKDNYGRAWRRLSLAIDMVGFLVEDKNRSNGVFYIKYSNIEIDDQAPKKKKGMLSKLAFWADDDEPEEDLEGQAKYRKEIEAEGRSEESNEKKWSFWGNADEQNVPPGEKRFRIRIIETDGGSKVYIDYPDETVNKTRTAESIINILYDYLKS
jgi:outer membrane protein assembly factor BamC